MFFAKAPLLLATVNVPEPEVATGTTPVVAPFASYVMVRTGRATVVELGLVQFSALKDRAYLAKPPRFGILVLPTFTVTEFTEE